MPLSTARPTLPSDSAQLFNVSRRSFIKRCAATAALSSLPTWFVEHELAAAESPRPPVSPNARPGIALIGCGNMGKRDAGNAASWGEVVAVCDVDATRAAAAAEQLTVESKVPTVLNDFRRVMERKDVHVIVNATPDHWHTLINIAAARAGKDIYAEKPLTLTIDEGRHVVEAVRKNHVVLQTGTQQRSIPRFRLACELVRNGRIGTLQQASVWVPAGLRDGPFQLSPVPEGLNWDYWLGQAPKVDYITERCHQKFRFWYDYSGGTMTDWGAHHNDIAYWAIGQVAPHDIEATALTEPIAGGFTAHSDYRVTYTYPDAVRLVLNTTRDDDPNGKSVKPGGQRNGIRFEGSLGWIWVNRDEIKASDPELLKDPIPDSAIKLYNSTNHLGNFFDCVQSRQDPICNVEVGHRSATMCHLGAIALRTGLKLQWDAKTERFIGNNARAANRHVSRIMRKPYDYSYVS